MRFGCHIRSGYSLSSRGPVIDDVRVSFVVGDHDNESELDLESFRCAQ